MFQTYGYFEWDLEEAEAAKRRAAEVENLYDRETRIRMGELIARAMRSPGERAP